MYARVRECEFSRRVLQDDQSSGRAGSSVRRRTIFFSESHRVTRVRIVRRRGEWNCRWSGVNA